MGCAHLVAVCNQSPFVEFAEPNYVFEATSIPNDPRFSEQWAHENTEVIAGWDLEQGRSDVVIAIIDTGVDINPPDLKDNIWTVANGYPGKDFVQVNIDKYSPVQLYDGEHYTGINDDPSDFVGHGTGVAGIAAAKWDNSIGVSGVCWNCQIMPVRAGYFVFVPDQFGGGTRGLVETSDMIPAMTFAVDSGADIINMSFGGQAYKFKSVEMVINEPTSQGVFMVGAAGNSGVTSGTEHLLRLILSMKTPF